MVTIKTFIESPFVTCIPGLLALSASACLIRTLVTNPTAAVSRYSTGAEEHNDVADDAMSAQLVDEAESDQKRADDLHELEQQLEHCTQLMAIRGQAKFLTVADGEYTHEPIPPGIIERVVERRRVQGNPLVQGPDAAGVMVMDYAVHYRPAMPFEIPISMGVVGISWPAQKFRTMGEMLGTFGSKVRVDVMGKKFVAQRTADGTAHLYSPLPDEELPRHCLEVTPLFLKPRRTALINSITFQRVGGGRRLRRQRFRERARLAQPALEKGHAVVIREVRDAVVTEITDVPPHATDAVIRAQRMCAFHAARRIFEGQTPKGIEWTIDPSSITNPSIRLKLCEAIAYEAVAPNQFEVEEHRREAQGPHEELRRNYRRPNQSLFEAWTGIPWGSVQRQSRF
jgi:hypothetical protein